MKIVYDDNVLSWVCRDLVRLRPVARFYYSPLVDEPADPLTGRPERYFPPGLWASAIGGPGRPWLFRFPFPHHPVELLASQRGYGGLEPEPDARPELAGQVFVTDDALAGFKSIRHGSWEDRADQMGALQFLTPAQSRFLMHLFTPVTALGDWWGQERSEEYSARKRLYEAAGIDRPYTRAVGSGADSEFNTKRRKDIWTGIDPSTTVRI